MIDISINKRSVSLPKSILRTILFLSGMWMAQTVMSQAITVKQDGTGDFTVIQDAVDAASGGDTVLVFPGIYNENVDITEKAIVLASTWVIHQADSLIRQTVIDGNQQGSCVLTTLGNEWAEIIGFTLQNGTGTNYLAHMYPYLYGSGGGVYIWKSKVKVRKCIISNNFAWFGAGIASVNNSQAYLSGNIITNNWAVAAGGGIRSASSSVVYDSIVLNSVYLNYGAYGSDIATYYSDVINKIWLDTCTVADPDQYYIGKFSDHAVHTARPPISVLHGKIEPVNADLYVGPQGNDTNSGLSPGEPLKTISFALLKIVSDSIDPKTVHVADGAYSPSLTGEHTPLQLKNHVRLVGQSRDNTVIDCENKYEGARFAFGQDYSYVKNIAFHNGNGYPSFLNGGLSTGYSRMLVLDSVAFFNCTGYLEAVIYSDSDDTLIVKNSYFHKNMGGKIVTIFNKYYKPPRYVEMISNEFSWNYPDTNEFWEKRHRTLSLSGSMTGSGHVYAKIINCLFHNNLDSNPPVPVPVPVAITASYYANLTIVNSTFADNSTTNGMGGAIGLAYTAAAHLYNCVFYGNIPNQLVQANTPDKPSVLNIYYSLIQDGQEGVINWGGYNIVEWGEGNLDENPLFVGSGEHPYAIDFGSPCIDAGTLDLPPGITLPEFDLAGNPRVWGTSVDMGAYEHGPWVSLRDPPNSKFKIQHSKLLMVSPNPFRFGTYISYEMKEKGRLNISLYSLAGLKVKTLVSSQASPGDKGSFYWDGSDQNGQSLPAGIYLIRMTLDGKELETVRAVKQ